MLDETMIHLFLLLSFQQWPLAGSVVLLDIFDLS